MSIIPSPPRTWPFRRLNLPGRLPLIALAAGLLLLVIVSIFLAAFSPAREALLRTAGGWLVATDPAAPADVIVIAVDSDGAGVLAAADLYKAGLSRRVAVFSDPPDAVVDREFMRRGLHYYNAAEIALQQLHELGVAEVEVIQRPVTGTEDESWLLPQWGLQHGFHKILFVANTDHTRRTRREFARAARGSGLTIMILGSPYSAFNPGAWWHSREGVRTEVIETQKLLLDVLRHPFG